MEVEITLPAEVPVMTLPYLVFFPQALLPLHIFEPRYREMLRVVLASNRLFAVACLDPAPAENSSAASRRHGRDGAHLPAGGGRHVEAPGIFTLCLTALLRPTEFTK